MATGPQTTVGWAEPAIVSNFDRHIFETFRAKANIIMQRHFMLKFVFIVSLTKFFYLDFGDNYVKRNEDTAILPATQMFAGDSSFWWYKVYADIRWGSRTRRGQLTVG